MLDDTSLGLLFPNLQPGDFVNTSSPTAAYNCIAWAAGRSDAWWEPINEPGYYWPDDLLWEYGTEVAVLLFQTMGFAHCGDAALEDGFEKIAIFSDGNEYTHAARQLESGRWTSKIGAHQDIKHTSPESLSGKEYGKVVHLLKRPRPAK